MNFTNKFNKAIATNNSLLIVGLDPNPEMMSDEYIQGDEDTLINCLEAWLLFINIADI